MHFKFFSSFRNGKAVKSANMRHLLPHGPAVKIFIFLSDGNRFPEVSVLDNKKKSAAGFPATDL